MCEKRKKKKERIKEEGACYKKRILDLKKKIDNLQFSAQSQ